MVRLVLTVVLALGIALGVGGSLAWASAQGDIAAATGEGKAVFVVVTQAGAREPDRAMQIAGQAQAMAPSSTVVVLDRGVQENQELVKAFRLAGAPVPLILVVAHNGVVAGGALLKDATPQALVRLIPTPKKAQMLLAMTQGQAVFVACTEAMKRLERKAATVVVDVEDEAEAAWIKELNVSPKEEAPVTIVFNAKGQKTQVFRGAVSAEQLVQAVNKKVECCPGGSC